MVMIVSTKIWNTNVTIHMIHAAMPSPLYVLFVDLLTPITPKIKPMIDKITRGSKIKEMHAITKPAMARPLFVSL